MRFLRPPGWNTVLTLVMVPILALTSVTMAVARGHAPAVGQVVICSGYGIVTIAVDADGNPTEAVQPCPDCVAGQSALPAADFSDGPRARVAPRVLPFARGLVRGAQPALVPPARGPPDRT